MTINITTNKNFEVNTLLEKTLVILKPDAVRRKLAGEIIARFEKKGFTLVQVNVLQIPDKVAREHYSHIKHRDFFEDMISYFTSGPSLIIELEGEDVIQSVRNMMGKTKCSDSPPGTIRGDYGYHFFENLIHASDSGETAENEIKRFIG